MSHMLSAFAAAAITTSATTSKVAMSTSTSSIQAQDSPSSRRSHDCHLRQVDPRADDELDDLGSIYVTELVLAPHDGIRPCFGESFAIIRQLPAPIAHRAIPAQALHKHTGQLRNCPVGIRMARFL